MSMIIKYGDIDQKTGVYKGKLISCPRCGKIFSLSKHTIDDKNKVFPSVVCPFNCGFHEFITLEIKGRKE